MLIQGEVNPARPVYWAIRFHDPDTKKAVSTRLAWDKYTDPTAAAKSAYGVVTFSDNFTAYNLGTTMEGARKKIRELRI